MTLPCRSHVHLYRSLLREAGYLFDSTAQTFHTGHIKWSFQRQRTKLQDLRRKVWTDDGLALCSQRESQQLKRARKYLRMLERANQGYSTAIKNVLRLAYGRVGKLRRTMVKGIMTPEPEAGSKVNLPLVNYDATWRPPDKFSTLLKNQKSVQPNMGSRKKRIQEFPVVPEKNKWNKDFPACRVPRIMREWYVRHADLLMPPQQETEWLQVYQAATNVTNNTTFKIPPRRSLASVAVFATAANHDLPVEWASKVDQLARTTSQRPLHSRKQRAEIGNPHHLTGRFLRRAMQQYVLPATVAIVVDPGTGKTLFRRASGVGPPSTPSTCTVSQRASLFDEGGNEDTIDVDM